MTLLCLSNWLRNRLRGTLFARLVLGMACTHAPQKVLLVSATRLNEEAFWATSALGRSLKMILPRPQLTVQIQFENSEGLPAVYNRALDATGSADAVVWVHDDVWLDDQEWIAKVQVGLTKFDVIGVAGNTRRVKFQPAWPFCRREHAELIWDTGFLSGAVAHSQHGRGPVSDYGPSPAHCELLDGVFLAARVDELRKSQVRFDERFQFHFYDLDLCRSARHCGLSLGTWPISVTHQSIGAFGGSSWELGLNAYFDKWKS
jgi:hypothetical protein